MFSETSNFNQGVDTAFFVIFGISIFFLIAITTVMIYFVVHYNKKKHPVAVQNPGNTSLELLWTIVPLILVMVMFYYGYIAFTPERKAPKDAIQVQAIARMWNWEFVYPNGGSSPELVVPLKKPVKLNLKAMDVIHSLYIPAFRIKEDMVPGKNNMMWFTANELGTYEILCAEYCGLRHSYMESKVKVLPQAEYDKWYVELEKNKALTNDEGKKILLNNACLGCHSIDGTKLVGPSFKGFFTNKRQVITNGIERTITPDDEYLKKSILEPKADVVKGFNENLMKSYKGIVKEEDFKKISEYLRNIDAKK